ncbi:unnamed protein product [Miscanthus lutarioriparius]|uniref:Uncharacterized protein n=1 Tax=Miscanthus lutarioriparius TaxID=422564 RepID=A0A811M5U7_9POAL|nr:unnamed protein product [Miscanthus lutarioriparius]
MVRPSPSIFSLFSILLVLFFHGLNPRYWGFCSAVTRDWGFERRWTLPKFQKVSSHVEGDEMPLAANMDCEGMPNEVPVVKEKMEFEGFEWAEVPQYGETIAGPPMPEEEEKEHFMTVGCDPDGDEPTGVDEEWRYFKPIDIAVNDTQLAENIEVVVQKRKRAMSVLDFDSECVHDDEATMIDDYVAPFTTHDKENPVINEGDTFGDKDEFIMTLRTYAIKNEFDTRVEHSDKERYKTRINNSKFVGASTTDAGTSKAAVEPSPTPHSSPGVTTRKMSSLPPTSPGVTTRRMAAISPGGINQRLIIE